MHLKINIEKMITISFLLFMPLSTYPIINNSITLGDMLLVVSLILMIYKVIKYKEKIKLISPLIIYIIMIIMISLFQFVFNIQNISDSILGILRYLLYLVFCLLISKNYINMNYSYSIYKKISIIFACYTILQFIVFYVFHRILPINVLGLKTFKSVYWYDNISRYANGLAIYRPCSVFIEPAHYVAYQAPILYLITNNIIEENEKNKYYVALLIASILLSGSTTGIIIIVFCLFRKIISGFKKNFILGISVMIFLSIFAILFFRSSYGLRVWNRTVSSEGNGAIEGRIGNIDIIFSNEYNHLIGNGLSSNTEYLPSYPYLIFSYGILGFVVFGIAMLKTYLKCNYVGKKMLILFLFISTGTLAIFGIASVLYLGLIYTNYNDSNENLIKENL